MWRLMGWTAAGLAVGLGLAAGLAFWFRPLAVNAAMERFSLRRAGLHARFVTGPAGRIRVWTGGSGPSLVLLHGAGDQAGTWSRVMASLVPRYRVIVPDLPGHGESGPEDGPLDVGMMVAGVRAVLDETSDGKPVTLVGNSLGAWVAMLIARDTPDRVRKVVLVNGGPIRGHYHGPGLVPESVKEARQLMITLMGARGALVPDFVLKDVIREAHSGPLARLALSAAGMEQYLMDEQLDRVTVPVALVWGMADGMFDRVYADRLRAGLPDATFLPLQDCGHVPQRQCPDRFTDALVQALKVEQAGESTAGGSDVAR